MVVADKINYKFFLGCVIPARLPFIERSARKVFDKLDIELETLENFSCCPDPTGVPAVSHDVWVTLGARNLSLIQDENSQILSLCSGCVETLKTANHLLDRDSSLKQEVNRRLKSVGRQINFNVAVKHGGQILYEQIEELRPKITRPLTNLKVAVHYGCHYLRPAEIIQWDDPFEPHTIDELIKTIGAESVQYSAKMDCCGGPLLKNDEELSLKMLDTKLQSIQDSGADCVAVVCPACFLQFEYQQKSVNALLNKHFDFPIFYLTELVALAMGFSSDELGLKFHRIKTKKILESLQIE